MSGCCGVDPFQKEPTAAEKSETIHIEFAVYGMGCGSCAQRVKNSLLRVSGVNDARVDYFSGLAQVMFNPEMTNTNELFQAVVRAGGDGKHNYTARLLSYQAKAF
ncbi:MAG: hypothetical protein GTO18_17925 [Anaerolineales bacterium]|nr:hypothetical protein [Anaerolineales bacterium]